MAGMVYLVYKALGILSVCVQRLWQLYGVRGQVPVHIPTASIQNAICAKVVPMEGGSAMHVYGIVHLVYKALRDILVSMVADKGHPQPR